MNFFASGTGKYRKNDDQSLPIKMLKLCIIGLVGLIFIHIIIELSYSEKLYLNASDSENLIRMKATDAFNNQKFNILKQLHS